MSRGHEPGCPGKDGTAAPVPAGLLACDHAAVVNRQPGRRAVRVRAGWAIGGACLGLGVAAINLRLATGAGAAGHGAAAGPQVSGINDTLQGLAGVLPAMLIVTRRPAHPIGWLSLAIAAGFSVAGFAAEYARAAVIGPLPGLPD